MKIAVTGATGFVGRRVVAALAERSDLDVTLAMRDRAASSAADALPARFRTVALDVAAPAPDDFDKLGRPDVLLHLAWGGLPNYKSLHHFEKELPQQFRFLAGLVRSGLPALVCTGTCFEYGMTAGALDESLETAPTNPYGFAKDALRRQLSFLRQETPFALTWARLFYMYGEGQSPQSLHSQLMAAGRRGDRRFPMSGGEQLRDFLAVDAVAERLVALALRAHDDDIVNVCSGQPVSVRGIVERWIRENDWSIELELGRYPYPDYEPFAFWGRRERLDALLGH